MSDFFFNTNRPWFFIIVIISIILFFTAPYALVAGFITYAIFSNKGKPKSEPQSTFFRDETAKYANKSLADFDFQALLDTDGQFMSAENKLAYLQSPKWYSIRIAIIAADDFKCQVCGSKHNLEVHHITYANLGNEKPEQLGTVCRACHQAIHDKLGYDRTTLYPIK